MNNQLKNDKFGSSVILDEIGKSTGWLFSLEDIKDNFISFIPTGYPRYKSFSTILKKSKLRITSEVILGSLARPLSKELGRVSKNKRELFHHAVGALEDELINVRIQCGSYQGPATNMKDWPKEWNDFHLSLTQPLKENDDTVETFIDMGIKCITLMNTILPLETIEKTGYEEGAISEVKHTFYERNIKNRKIALDHHGNACKICNFRTDEKYGKDHKDIIEVHHVVPVSEMGRGYLVDPRKDLVPLCPNCHSLVHKRKPAFTIDEIKEQLSVEKL